MFTTEPLHTAVRVCPGPLVHERPQALGLAKGLEFCVHIVRAFTVADGTKTFRAQVALARMGTPVFNGIALTKLIGVLVLSLSQTEIFQIYYFRMYFILVVLSTLHAFVLLPVLLMLAGPPRLAYKLAGEFDSMTNIENVAWNGLPSDAIATWHSVKVTDHETGEVLSLDVPEGRYVLFEAEQDGWELPNACRMGCCTKCAVKVTKGKLEQPEALGLSKKYRDEGYALLCVSTAASDVECVTQDEEEVYQMQFGELFQQLATDVESGAVVRDDFALEIADMDE